MELKQYWRIVKRRWWIIILLTLFTTVASFLISPEMEAAYMATTKMIISVPPELRVGEYFGYNKYYSWLSSEYLVDDFSEVVKSDAFAQDIKAELGDNTIDIGAIKGHRSTEKTHRVLTLEITSKDPEQALQIAKAAAKVIQKRGKEYFAQLSLDDAQVRVIDPPTVSRQMRSYLAIGLRIALGFFSGLALVFLLHYLDSSIYDAGEVERLIQVRVLGEIPPE